MRPATALRLLIGAVLLLAVAGLSAVLAGNASAGAVDKVTVNSTANTDDGLCTGPPNDLLLGNCTLHEAIDQVNLGLAEEINFHPTTFSKASPGVINLEGGLGCLPVITRDVVIDNTGTGVILDGDGNNSAPTDSLAQFCDGVIKVDASHNGFDFTLIGGKNFVIREFCCASDAIELDGNDFNGTYFSFGDVLISGVIVQDGDVAGPDNFYNIEDMVDVDDTTNVTNLQLTNNQGSVDDDGFDIDIDASLIGGGMLTNNTILINENSVVADFNDGGGGEAVNVDLDGDVAPGSKLLLNVIDNPNLTSLRDDAVDLEFCGGNSGDCDAGGSAINFRVNNNSKIHGGTDGDDAVDIDINAEQNTDRVDIDVQVNDNGLIDGDEDGINVDVDVCCDTSFSTSSVQVNGNDDIIGGSDGVDVTVNLGCGGTNDSTIQVNDNGSIEASDAEGVEVDANVGEVASPDNFSCDGSLESDENTSLIQVNGNERIDSGDDEGVEIDNDTGGLSGNGDDNVSTNEVIGNGEIAGGSGDQGVEVDTVAGTQFTGTDADENVAMVTVNDNGNISGDDDGVDIDATSGVAAAIDALPFDDPPGGPADADDNLTDIVVAGNGNITGDDGDGVAINAASGGNNASADDNANRVSITGNGELIGRQATNGAGVDVTMEVCCHSDDDVPDNTLNIADNGDIIGRNSDGLEVDLCCSFNVVNITDNGTFRGNGGDGINISVDDDVFVIDGDPFPGDCPEDCGIWNSLTILTMTGNEVFNSESDGVDITAGAMQFPLTQGPGDAPPALKSVISGNDIHHNRDSGIELENSFGVNIVDNLIYSNGDDPSDDSGITIKTEQNGSGVFLGNTDFIPANRNTISQNSIFDNIGLGIDLVGDPDKDGFGEAGIGCNQFPAIPSPNDCIPFPIIQTLSNNKLVGDACAGCHVEIFVADDTPADQPPLGDQHGEGITYLVTGTADDLGDWSINLPCGLGDMQVTATATDKSKNTSEFARNFTVLGIPCTPTPPPPTNTSVPTATSVPPTATSVPPTATPVTPSKECGDVNDDGIVNAIDVTLLLQLKAALIGSLVNEPSGDVNNNGELTSVDAALILQRIAGLILPSALTCPA